MLALLAGALALASAEGLAVGLIAAAAGATLALGAWLRVRGERSAEPDLVPDASYATVAVALGLAGALAGVAWGRWLMLMGLGLAALGAAGLVREGRAAARERAG
jgi:hypothetical protein